ncbi:hypothetical protein SKAU_G00047070 [Synaphobranchus kaupii]|uniref:Uncharacterized protein n=1 Tax=Synaphobranchus kaupii TaxID=118154 RepID=A0A9Q1G379_SYNKA|nr:hypothetical protein SKAU_G00047070 [Synaphobranchus kaupii]
MSVDTGAIGVSALQMYSSPLARSLKDPFFVRDLVRVQAGVTDNQTTLASRPCPYTAVDLKGQGSAIKINSPNGSEGQSWATPFSQHAVCTHWSRRDFRPQQREDGDPFQTGGQLRPLRVLPRIRREAPPPHHALPSRRSSCQTQQEKESSKRERWDGQLGSSQCPSAQSDPSFLTQQSIAFQSDLVRRRSALLAAAPRQDPACRAAEPAHA